MIFKNDVWSLYEGMPYGEHASAAGIEPDIVMTVQ